MLRGRIGTETMSDGADGDGYKFCGNGWGWFDFPLPCRSLVVTSLVGCHVRALWPNGAS